MLPRDLGEWQSTVEFALGPYTSGKDLGEISAVDLSRAGERDVSALCRQGYGALLAKLAEGIPVQLDTAVKLVDIIGRGAKVELSTTKGSVTGRFCIITASTNAILDRIKFDGGLPKRQQDAMEKLRLGNFDHIALELPGNPLGLPRDDVVFEKSSGPRTGALTANIGGTTLSTVSVGGKFGRDLAAQGDKAMVEFAVEWLGGMFGPDVKKALGRTQVTQWSKEQWIAGRDRDSAPGWQQRAPHPDGADPQPRVLRRRSGARDRVGHGRRRLGIRHPHGRRGGAPHHRASPNPRPEGEARAGPREAGSGAQRAKKSELTGRAVLERECQRASRSFSQPTIVLAISSGCWPGVRPMWWPSG